MRAIRLLSVLFCTTFCLSLAAEAEAHCGNPHDGADAVADCGQPHDEDAVAGCGHCEEQGCGGGCEGCRHGRHKEGHHDKPHGKAQASAEMKEAMGNTIEAYLDLQEALAADDLDGSKSKIKALGKKLAGALGRGDADGLEALVQQAKKANAALDKAESLKEMRAPFGDLSKAMIAMERKWGPTGEATLYLAYCPMALNNEGAHWLQRKEQVANPYYGHMMLRCGESKALN